MADGAMSSVSPENGNSERSLGIIQPDRVLFSPEIKRILDKSTDATAFDNTVAASIFLLAQTADPLKSLSTVASLLDTVDFNNKDVFPDHGHSGTAQLNRDIYADLAIGLQERETSTAFESSVDNAIFLAARAIERFGRINFHGTNSVALEGIKRLGLIRGEKGYEQDIDPVVKLLTSIGESEQVFGWYKLNSEGRIFLTGDTYGAYKYAEGSPEWFDQFTSKWNPKQPYRHRDHQEARRYLEEKIQGWSNRTQEALNYGHRNLTADEGDRIREFFEKYWDIYGNSEPVIVQVDLDKDHDISGTEFLAMGIQSKKNLLQKNLHYGDGDEKALDFMRTHCSFKDIKKGINFQLAHQEGINDQRVEGKDLLPSHLRYFILPRFNKE